MSQQTQSPHPLTPQLAAAIAHYGIEDVLVCLSEATSLTAENMRTMGADEQTVNYHRSIAKIFVDAAVVGG